MFIKLELQVVFQHSNVGLVLLNVFPLVLFLYGTKYIWILEIHLLQCLKSTYLRKYNLILIHFTTFTSLLA